MKNFLKLLIKKLRKFNVREPGGKSILYMVALTGDLDSVKQLVESGADVNFTNNEGRIPLHAASLCGYFSVVEYLIDQKSNVNTIEHAFTRWTPLHLAAQLGHEITRGKRRFNRQ